MDHRVVANLAEMTEASNNITTLKRQLAEALEQLVKFKVVIDVNVVPDGDRYSVRITSAANGRVVNYHLDEQEVLYFGDDTGSLINRVASQIILDLLLPPVTEILTPKLKAAVTNVARLTKSKGMF